MLLATTQGTLPPRDSVRTAARAPRISRRLKIGIGTLIVVSLVLAVAVAIAAPRPNVSIQNAAYSTSGCIASSTSQVVTATFGLVNTGTADGYVTVRLDSDGTGVGSHDYLVSAGSAIPGRIDATLQDCSTHRYSLYLSYVPPPAGG